MAERAAIIHLALFGFLAITLGIEASAPIMLVASGFCRILPAIVSPLTVRRAIRTKQPATASASPSAQTFCRASP